MVNNVAYKRLFLYVNIVKISDIAKKYRCFL